MPGRVAKVLVVIWGGRLKVLREELGLDVTRSSSMLWLLAGRAVRKTIHLLDSDIGASIASGSYPIDGMLVIPCTTGCLAQIANGISSSTWSRKASVAAAVRRRAKPATQDRLLSRP